MGTTEQVRVDRHWSRAEPARDEPTFYGSPILRPYLIETAYGSDLSAAYADRSYFAEDIVVDRYLAGRRVESILSLCCGFGAIERRFVTRLGSVRRCLGLDVAVGALAVARQRAGEAGHACMSYECADIDRYAWPDRQYDLIVANGALHHLQNLEGVLDGIRAALRPDGLFYACEYAGPSRQDHGARQMELINAAAYLVPPELRARRGLSCYRHKRLFRLLSRLYVAAARPPKPHWPAWKRAAAVVLRKGLAARPGRFDFGAVYVSAPDLLRRSDPSEGVRAAAIVPQVLRRFPRAEIRPFGGGILQYALDERFYTAFEAGNPVHAQCLDLLCRLERGCMRTGEIGPENAFILAGKDGPPGRAEPGA